MLLIREIGRALHPVCALLVLLCAPSLAGMQDPAAGGEEAAAMSTPAQEEVKQELLGTYEDPAIPLAQLELRLKPLTQEELKDELHEWIKIVEAKQGEISFKDIEALKAKEAGEDNAELVAASTALTIERGKLVSRAEAVVKAYKDKGGDPATEELYLDAISGVTLKTDDASALLTQIKSWAMAPEGGILLATNIGKFVGLMFVFLILSRIISGIVAKALKRVRNMTDLLRNFFINTTRKVVLLVGAIIAVSQLGVDIGPMIAAIGAVGFVVGFALSDTLSNFASGLMILFYRPYDVGHVINVAGEIGKVEQMSLVSTTIRTADNQIILIPNNSIWGGTITNVTGTDKRRVDLVFGIGYEDDIPKAEKVLEEVVKAHKSVLEDPAITIKVHELADSSVNFVVRPWVKTSDYWDVYWDLTRQVKMRFDAEGISIPYPQQDVHMHDASAA